MSLSTNTNGFNSISFLASERVEEMPENNQSKGPSAPINIRASDNNRNWFGVNVESGSETQIIITPDTPDDSTFSRESSFLYELSDSYSMSTSTYTSNLTSRSGSVVYQIGRKVLKSSTSCPEENSLLESPSDHVSVILDSIKKAQCRTKEKVGYNLIFGEKEGACFPFLEQHVHLEGIFTAEELLEMAVKENLFYAQGLFRRREYSSKTNVQRIPASRVLLSEIKAKACIKPRVANIFEFDDLGKDKPFDETFKIRGSILDRVKFSTQLLGVMKKAKDQNILYRELMYGIYDIPVPKMLIDYVENLKNPMEENEILCCLEILKKNLKDLLSEEEQKKLKIKIQHRFHLEGKDVEALFLKLLDMHYSDAKEFYLSEVFTAAESEIKEAVIIDNATKGQYALDPEISIFSAKSVRTLKLIDEIMRHRSLGEFIAWLYAACNRMQKSRSQRLNGIEVGLTVDGPQNLSAKKNFDSQINFLLKMRSLFPDVPVSMHALEYPVNSSFEIKDELKHVIKVCEANEGRGLGRIGHGTRAADANDIGKNLDSIMKKGLTFEFSATTAELTTETAIEDMPIGYLHRIGVAITFNTDDPGIFDKITLRSEIARVIKAFNFSYEDIKNAMRTAIESSFARGDSIYNIQKVKETIYVNNVLEAVTRLKYNIKNDFINYCDGSNCSNIDHVLEISEKAYKQIQLERAFIDFEKEMFSEENVEISQSLGFRHKRSKSNPEPCL